LRVVINDRAYCRARVSLQVAIDCRRVTVAVT
jgi:hypothetical protein